MIENLDRFNANNKQVPATRVHDNDLELFLLFNGTNTISLNIRVVHITFKRNLQQDILKNFLTF